MWPLLPDGRVVSVRPARMEDVRVGDVVVVRLAGCEVCHRVFRKWKGKLQTKADDSPLLDPPVEAEDLIAVADAGRLGGGRIGYLISRLSLITARWYSMLGTPGKMFLRACEKRWGEGNAEVNRAIIGMLGDDFRE